jgi:hypothetical protein
LERPERSIGIAAVEGDDKFRIKDSHPTNAKVLVDPGPQDPNLAGNEKPFLRA